MRSSLLTALTAISLVAAPTASLAATPGSAAALSLAPTARAGAPVQDANQLDDIYYIGAGVVVLALILIFVVLDDDDEPSSP